MSALKCKDCRHFEPSPTEVFFHGSCRNPRVHGPLTRSRSANVKLDIVEAREICNKEGDGIFVHFEPKIPGNGAAFGESRREFELDRLGQTGQDNAAAFKAAA